MNNLLHPRLESRLRLCCVLLLFVLLWTVYPHQFIASDPWAYSYNAWRIARGEFFCNPGNHPFSHRLGVTLPVALCYAVFGVSIRTTHIWPLLAGLLLVITVWSALPDERSRNIGLLLSLGCMPLLKGMTILLPDLIVAAFLGLSSLLLYRRRAVLQRGARYRLLPVIAVAALFLAFLAKLTAWWGIPFWLIVFLVDLRRRERGVLLRFHVPALVTALVVGGAYLLFCSSVWGDPFSRIHGVTALTGEHLWSWATLSAREKLLRLIVAPPLLFGGYYGMTFVFALLAIPIVPKRMRFWGVYVLCIALLFWFGGTGFSGYEPLPISGRMTLPLLPGLLILASIFIASATVDIPGLSVRTSKRLVDVVLIGVAVLPLFSFLVAQDWTTPAEARVAEIIRHEAKLHPHRRFLLLCSDVRSPESLAFYFGYRYPHNLRAVSLDSLDPYLPEENDCVFLFLHEERSRFLHDAYGYGNRDRQIRDRALICGRLVCEDRGIWLWQTHTQRRQGKGVLRQPLILLSSRKEVPPIRH